MFVLSISVYSVSNFLALMYSGPLRLCHFSSSVKNIFLSFSYRASAEAAACFWYEVAYLSVPAVKLLKFLLLFAESLLI